MLSATHRGRTARQTAESEGDGGGALSKVGDCRAEPPPPLLPLQLPLEEQCSSRALAGISTDVLGAQQRALPVGTASADEPVPARGEVPRASSSAGWDPPSSWDLGRGSRLVWAWASELPLRLGSEPHESCHRPAVQATPSCSVTLAHGRGRLWKRSSSWAWGVLDMLPEEPESWAAIPCPFCARILRTDGGTTLISSVWQDESLVVERALLDLLLSRRLMVEK